MTDQVLALLGPTACGKTTTAIAVAKALADLRQPAEIISGDSMLVYRGMDIGTAKPTIEERAGLPHHLVDIFHVCQTASVAQFQSLARAAIADCQARGVLPIVVGGSALYMHAVLDDMEFPATDPALRAHWQEELDRIGPQALHAMLATRDPDVAAGILPGNGRRIVRALEAIELTGSFASHLPPPSYFLGGVTQIGLEIDRATLNQRIEARVDAMWQAGLVDEVAWLADHGLRDGLTASRALGYRQVLAYLDGQTSLDEARLATIAATRRFARKQAGWFKRDTRIHWLAYDDPNLVGTVIAKLGLGHGGRMAV